MKTLGQIAYEAARRPGWEPWESLSTRNQAAFENAALTAIEEHERREAARYEEEERAAYESHLAAMRMAIGDGGACSLSCNEYRRTVERVDEVYR